MRHPIAGIATALVLSVGGATPVRAAAAPATSATTLAPDAAGRFAARAQRSRPREPPTHTSTTRNSPADARPPHELTPAFYGCLDWHSDVHGHWLLGRLLRLFPQAPFAEAARTELARSFTAANVAGELAYLHGAGRA